MSSYDAALIDTAIIEHPDFLELPRGTRYLYVEALVWSRLHHTNGAIPRHMPRHFSDEPDPDAATAALVATGRWEATEAGWQIAGFLDKQMSAERIDEKRALSRKRWDNFVANKGQRVGKRVSNGSDPTRPDPTRKGRDGGMDQEAGDASAAPGGAEPAVAASPAERRWLPVTADDYDKEEWRDDFYRCERCRGLYQADLFSEDEEDAPILCPFCLWVIQRQRGQDCYAFIRAKKDAPSRPCRQRRQAGTSWCQYHQRDDSRGQAPLEIRPAINAKADRAIAALSAPKLESVAEPVDGETAEDAVNVREAVRLWLKHRPNEPIPTPAAALLDWLRVARHDLSLGAVSIAEDSA